MKNKIRYWLQTILGFDTFLFLFALYWIYTLFPLKKEKGFIRFVSLIPKNTIILDIGANIGIMTIPLAKRIPGAFVHAIEPIPAHVKALERIIAFFKVKNVKVHPIALGDSTGTIRMVMPVQNGAKLQGLAHIDGAEAQADEDGIAFDVAIMPLDDLAKTFTPGMRIGAIKIDVENYEAHVLRSGLTLLKTHRPVIYCELKVGDNRKQCFELFNSLGYTTQVLIDEQLIDFAKTQNCPEENFFFIPPAQAQGAEIAA